MLKWPNRLGRIKGAEFKYRNKIGQDVAIEALRECWRERMCDMEEVVYCAWICRVARVMKPYLEMLS